MTHHRHTIVIGLLGLLLVAAVPARTADLGQVLTRFDEVQRDVHSISANFTMTTESMLLKDKLVSTGRIYMTKPDAVRWEFESPEEMRFVIAEDEYTGYFPEQKRAERRDVQRWREQLFRFLGLGQASSELAKFYEITLADESHRLPGMICLDLDPKKARVKKRMDSVRFWIDETTYMPVRVEYNSKKGDRRVIEFAEMDLNPTLAADLYSVDLPPDVAVERGFSAFSGFGGTATN